MTITQTVAIPENRRLTIDVPHEVPAGVTARIELVWPIRPQADDVYAGIPSKLDDDLLRSQLDVLEQADW
ncbi:MAG: hypothetical protein FWG07_07305 [Treponema sp.]|nr:hypothetical protein [Treponema sp.]